MLAVLTPFEGKTWALDRWLGALQAANLPADTHLVWLCNSPDPVFFRRLEQASLTMSWPVTLWQDAHKVSGPTPMHVKWDTVAYLYRELRVRLPEDVTHVLCLEDDVMLSPGTVGVLLAEAVEHGSMTVITGAPSNVSVEALCGIWVHTMGARPAAQSEKTARIDCCWFGCTLFPRALFDRLPLTSDWQRSLGYDSKAGPDTYQLGGQMVAVWEARCVHMEHPTILDAPIRQLPRAFDDFRAGNTDPRRNDKHAAAQQRKGRESSAHRAWRGGRPSRG